MMQAALRAAAAQLLTDYAQAQSIRLQVYRARPLKIAPPTAFVDRLRETVDYPGMAQYQRTPDADIVVVHGPSLESGDAADQKDAFVDGFLEYVSTRYHAAGGNTLVAVVSIEDDPFWVAEWLPPNIQETYYATTMTLRGYAENATV